MKVNFYNKPACYKPSFGITYDEAKPLRDDLEGYILFSPDKLSYDELNGIVQSYFPNVRVCPKRADAKKTAGAYYQPALYCCPKNDGGFGLHEPEYVKDARTVGINLPKEDNSDERKRILSFLKHELTHTMQCECEDRLSVEEYIYNILPEGKGCEYYDNTLQIMKDSFKKYEDDINVKGSLFREEYDTDVAKIEYFDEYYKMFCGKNFLDYLKFSMTYDINELKEKYKDDGFDEICVLKYIAYRALEEKEAYFAGGDKDMAAYYSVFAKAAKELAQEMELGIDVYKRYVSFPHCM